MADELQAKIDEALEKQKQELEQKFEDEVKGLKSTNAQLKQEKQEAIEKAQADLEAKEQEALEAAKKAGDIEKQLEIEKTQAERKYAKLNEDLEARNNLILSSKKEAAVQGITSHFAKQGKASSLLASQLVDYGFDDDGNVKASYKDLEGNVIADNHDQWLEFAKSNEDLQEYLAGSQASGADPSKNKPIDGKKRGEFDRNAKAAEINSRLQ